MSGATAKRSRPPRKGDPRVSDLSVYGPAFVSAASERRDTGPLRMAYADPPYPGMAHFYGTPEVNHEFLVRDLCEQFPDGWALSTASTTLKQVLAVCPDDVRIAAWTKPFASFKKGVNPGYCWEPVIFRGGRHRTDGTEPTVRDYCAVNITLERGFTGAKPEAFCWWVFDLLGLREGDEFFDLFPGSAAVTRAWGTYRTERLFASTPSCGTGGKEVA